MKKRRAVGGKSLTTWSLPLPSRENVPGLSALVVSPWNTRSSKTEAIMSSPPRRRRLEVEDIGDVCVVNFTDRKILDEQNIQIIGEQLFSLVDESGRRKVLLNFGNVEYLSSAALAKLITLNKKLQAVSGRLVLCNIDPQIREVFEITKLNKIFTIHDEEQSALQAF
jgi:anti-sigma B factor antagonist